MVIIVVLLFSIIFGQLSVTAQEPTVGLLKKDSLSYVGYTLFAPISDTSTYLIDNCGRSVHTWTSTSNPAFTAKLLENGMLLRLTRLGTSPVLAGAGGGIEILDWDGSVIWSYAISDSTYMMHHDAVMLDNGNLLLLVAEAIPLQEVIDAGRDSATLFRDLWSDMVVEIQPIGSDSAEIVWQWRVWDHVVQNRIPMLDNYGVISANRGSIDLNYISSPAVGKYRDWIHFNSIDFHEGFNQILLSSRSFNEVWVIDHSTTMAEARGTNGGRYGKGGQLLYRWGNPAAYSMGDSTTMRFNGQHDARWIPKGIPDEGKIAVFNNGDPERSINYSTVDLFDPPVDINGFYENSPEKPFLPEALSWQYLDTTSTELFSIVYSGSVFLPNGNVLISEGTDGSIREVDRLGNIHWLYVNPIWRYGSTEQGTVPRQNSLFKAYRYSASYPAFVGRDLSSSAPLELNPFPYFCDGDSIATSVSEDQAVESIRIATPNPFSDVLHITDLSVETSVSLVDVRGVTHWSGSVAGTEFTLNTSGLAKGVYFIVTASGKSQVIVKID